MRNFFMKTKVIALEYNNEQCVLQENNVWTEWISGVQVDADLGALLLVGAVPRADGLPPAARRAEAALRALLLPRQHLVLNLPHALLVPARVLTFRGRWCECAAQRYIVSGRFATVLAMTEPRLRRSAEKVLLREDAGRQRAQRT